MSAPNLYRDYLDTCFAVFPLLVDGENWSGLQALGAEALRAAENLKRTEDVARICTYLALADLCNRNIGEARFHIERAVDLSRLLRNTPLLIETLLIQSAVERKGQDYRQALDCSQMALDLYDGDAMNDPALLGKIHYQLGAVDADDPEGCRLTALTNLYYAEAALASVERGDNLCRIYLLQAKVLHKWGQQVSCQERLDAATGIAQGDRLKRKIQRLQYELTHVYPS